MLLANYNKNKGVVLLYAVLLVSIVLTISLSLMNIAYKQIILTSVNRDSQVAHFNAWSVVDCVRRANKFFKDRLNDKTSNPFGVFTFSPPPSYSLDKFSAGNWSTNNTIYTCGGNNLKIVSLSGDRHLLAGSVDPSTEGINSRYKLIGPGLMGGCAFVDVVKVFSGNYDRFPGEPESGIDAQDDRNIMITGFGYNNQSICNEPPGVNSRLIERRIRSKSAG